MRCTRLRPLFCGSFSLIVLGVFFTACVVFSFLLRCKVGSTQSFVVVRRYVLVLAMMHPRHHCNINTSEQVVGDPLDQRLFEASGFEMQFEDHPPPFVLPTEQQPHQPLPRPPRHNQQQGAVLLATVTYDRVNFMYRTFSYSSRTPNSRSSLLNPTLSRTPKICIFALPARRV